MPSALLGLDGADLAVSSDTEGPRESEVSEAWTWTFGDLAGGSPATWTEQLCGFAEQQACLGSGEGVCLFWMTSAQPSPRRLAETTF